MSAVRKHLSSVNEQAGVHGHVELVAKFFTPRLDIGDVMRADADT
jgi:hypothetical protein